MPITRAMSWRRVERAELELAGVVVRVSPLFPLLAFLAGWHYRQYVATTQLAKPLPPMPGDPAKLAAWLQRLDDLAGASSYPSPGWALAAGVGVGVAWCLSVVLHELGHLFAARAVGVGVSGLNLHLAGGFVEIEDEDRLTAGRLAAITGAGPLVTAALALVAWAGCRATPDAPTGAAVAVQAVLSFMFLVNAGALALNLLPFRALDGGQLLLALRLWVRRQGWATR